MIAGLVVLSLFGGFFVTYDPLKPDTSAIFNAPSGKHWMGTDQLGRDLFSRIVVGTGFSLQTAVIATLTAALLGIPIGLLGGYYGGWLGRAIDFLIDGMLALPGILLALAIVTALGPGFTNAMLALGISFSPVYARIVRGQVLTIKGSSYVEAARIIGCPDLRILVRHILPNMFAPLIVVSSLAAAGAILAGAGLSYLGLGPQPPTPEWGAIMFAGTPFISTAPWITLFPGLAIMLTVLAANLLGDGLRDALDPKQRFG